MSRKNSSFSQWTWSAKWWNRRYRHLYGRIPTFLLGNGIGRHSWNTHKSIMKCDMDTHKSIMKCDMDIRKTYKYANTALYRRSTMYPSMDDRMHRDLTGLTPNAMYINVFTPPKIKYSKLICGTRFRMRVSLENQIDDKLFPLRRCLISWKKIYFHYNSRNCLNNWSWRKVACMLIFLLGTSLVSLISNKALYDNAVLSGIPLSYVLWKIWQDASHL